MKERTGIDIIIPIYNALDDLKLCVESVKRHTDLTLDRLILIDDRSPDQNVYPYLQSIEDHGIVVLQNEQNQGFSGTINRGMQYSERDVLLLNSDTIVTARWIDKIVACAYSDPAIGTVTPFSNNATLCSIPNFCQENTIPYGLSIDEYAKIIERCSMRKYPKITVAVGFCMFIKREVVDKTGLFDQETFQKGYGEENDFCWRAEQLGYYHVLCDDTYIYHSGSMSFISDEKKQLMAEHEKIIQELYPKQNHENAIYVRDNPHQYLRDNVNIYAPLKNGKKNILYVLHMDFRTDSSNNIGGTQFHVKDLMLNLRGEYNVYVMARDADNIRLTAYYGSGEVSFKFPLYQKNLFQTFTSKELSKIYSNVLKAFSIDIVHIHHIMGLSFDIFQITKELEIPLMASLHDFYYVCPTIKLLENGTEYCEACGNDCAACISTELGYVDKVSYLPLWREECCKALKLCEVLIAPSQTVKDLYSKIYPEIKDRIRVISHGMDYFNENIDAFLPGATSGFEFNIEQAFSNGYCITGWAIQKGNSSQTSELVIRIEDSEGKCGMFYALPQGRPDLVEKKSSEIYSNCGFVFQIPDTYFATGELKAQLFVVENENWYHSEVIKLKGYKKREKEKKRIAFLGGLSPVKGSHLAYQMIKQSNDTFDWYIIGGIGDADLAMLENKNVYKLGWYKRENAVALLEKNQIDLVCILSRCPESFCYTLSEAELAGIPVLATDIGALGERINKSQTGWTIKPTTTGTEILELLGQIFSDENQFAQKKATVEGFRHKSIKEMCEEYAGLYKKLPDASLKINDFDAEFIYMAYGMCHMDSSGLGNIELIRRLNQLEATMNALNQSLEYRMFRFFNRENVPFKKQIKWLIGFAYRVYVKCFKK